MQQVRLKKLDLVESRFSEELANQIAYPLFKRENCKIYINIISHFLYQVIYKGSNTFNM